LKNNLCIENLFGIPKALIGMVHLEALPGTPMGTHSVSAVIKKAIQEAKLLESHGFHGILIENMHDRPYVKSPSAPEITAMIAVVAAKIKDAVNIPIGIQILAGANEEALAAAVASGASFVRVEGFVFAHIADEGLIEGCAGRLLRYRKQIGADEICIFADIKKKHSSHAMTGDVDIAETAHAAEFFLADGVIVTGSSTGKAADLDELKKVAQAVKIPKLIGSGITPHNIESFIRFADAFIVGSYIKKGGLWSNELDSHRMKELVSAFNQCFVTT